MDQEKSQVARKFSPGTETAVDGWNVENAPEWANGALQVERKNSEIDQDTGGIKDEIWISTQQEDRDGDVLVATGGRFDNYWKNPVVGWNHGFGSIDFPIGRAQTIDVIVGVGLASSFVWPPWKHQNPEMGVEAVDDIHRLWAGMFINAASVWFRILKADPKEGHENDWWPPLIVHEWELMEWALVYVPANQGAVRRSIKHIGESEYYCRMRRKFKQKEKRRGELLSGSEMTGQVGEVRNVIIPFDGLESLGKNINVLSNSLKNLKKEF